MPHAGIGDRQSRTIPTKDLLHQVVFLGGWCANFRNPKKKGKIRTTLDGGNRALVIGS